MISALIVLCPKVCTNQRNSSMNQYSTDIVFRNGSINITNSLFQYLLKPRAHTLHETPLLCSVIHQRDMRNIPTFITDEKLH